MTRSDLVKRLNASLPFLKEAECAAVVDEVIDAMAGALAHNRRIEIRNFGSFGTKRRQARIGLNPKTLERIHVPAKAVPYFKPGKPLLRRVDSLRRA